MSDLFISYSRKDTPLVRRLHDRLIEHDLDLWVDWEGIPPSAEWLDEINSAIDGSDAFLQVLSPDSVESTVCQLELDRAVRNNKRLIAVICRDVPAETVPKALGQINWIFLRETDNFEESVTALLDALRTDLDWARVHTRLLVRAVNWDNRMRPRALCLSGRELKEHQSWIARIGDKQPQLTELQHAYLAASRKAQKRRQTIMAAITVCVLTGGGALWWNADRQSSIALAQRISSEADASRIAAPENPGKALALAVEAMGRFKTLGIRSLNADSTLRRQLHLWPEPVATIDRPDSSGDGVDRVSAMAFTDSNELIVRYKDGAIDRWGIGERAAQSRTNLTGAGVEAIVSADLTVMASSGDDGITIRHIGSQAEPMVLDSPFQAGRIALSPGGNRIAVESGLFGMAILDTATGTELAYGKVRYYEGVNNMVDIAVADYGDYVAVIQNVQESQVSYRFLASVLDLANEKRRVLLDVHEPLRRIVMSPDGSRVVVPAGKMGAVVFDARNGAEIRRIETGSDVGYAAFNRDGSRIATVDSRRQARVWLLATGVEVARIGLPNLETPVVLSPGGSLLAVCQSSGRISIYGLQSLGDGMAFFHNEPVNVVALNDAGHIATASGTVEGFGALTLWDTRSGRIQKEWRLDDFIMADRVALSSDGKYMLLGTGTPVACGVTKTRLWSIENDREIAAIEHSMCGVPAALSADGRFFVYARFDEQIEVLDLPTGEVRGLSKGPLLIMGFNERGTHLAAGFESGKIRVWETTDWRSIWETESTLSGSVDLLTLDSEGTKLAVTTGNNIVQIFDIAGESAVLRLEHIGRVIAMAFDTAGVQLATGAEDGLARIWNTSSGAELARFAHTADVTAVAFGGTAATLATASADGYARLWNVRDGTEIGRFPHGAELTDLAVSKDGKTVFTAGRDGVVWQWFLESDALIHQACIRLPADTISKSGDRTDDLDLLQSICAPHRGNRPEDGSK